MREHVAKLTPRELEVCVLHFVECRSQLVIAEWLGIGGRTVRLHVKSAVKKIPQLKRLRVKSLSKSERPKIFHLSQLKPTERGAFNADEV
jgi:FixJ family two-component response regulator